MSRMHHLRNVEAAARELVLTSHQERLGVSINEAVFHKLVRTLMDARQDGRIADLVGELTGRPEGITAA